MVACSSSLNVGWTCLRMGLDAWVVVDNNNKGNKEYKMDGDCIFVTIVVLWSLRVVERLQGRNVWERRGLRLFLAGAVLQYSFLLVLQ